MTGADTPTKFILNRMGNENNKIKKNTPNL